jgi:hypothetical protein
MKYKKSQATYMQKYAVQIEAGTPCQFAVINSLHCKDNVPNMLFLCLDQLFRTIL